MKIKIGTRKSKLAMWQACYVQEKLQNDGIDTEILSMETTGDKVLDRSIAKIGSKGVFTEELETRLAAGTVDIAVHSAKDMPSLLPDGFELIAFTERERPEDVLVSHLRGLQLEDRTQKIVIGTSSVRRRALLKLHYPHVETVDIRGNLQTRLRKMQEGLCDGIMLAYAGVHRMELDEMIVRVFPADTFIPPVGQGCIAIEAARLLSPDKREAIRGSLNNRDSEDCLLAERAFLRRLEGGCSIPAFALAVLQDDTLQLSAGLVGLDGGRIIRSSMSGPRSDGEKIGTRIGDAVLNDGGRELLAEIRKQQD